MIVVDIVLVFSRSIRFEIERSSKNIREIFWFDALLIGYGASWLNQGLVVGWPHVLEH